MIAEVGLACGRFYLRIGRVIVAMQGDPIRDPTIQAPYNQWDEEQLRLAADAINGSIAALPRGEA